MSRKIAIEELPVTARFLRQKRVVENRGELALIEDGKTFKHLSYFSLKPGKGNYRGGHYHLKKVEHFYVISGRLRVRLVDLDTGERAGVNLHQGERVVIYPNCAHRFEALQESQVIEYYDSVYNPEDDFPFEDFRDT